MTITTCDVCGKEMDTDFYPKDIEDRHFCISSMGKPYDICDECMDKIENFVKKHNIKENK